MQVWAMASERATIGGPTWVSRTACNAALFHCKTTFSSEPAASARPAATKTATAAAASNGSHRRHDVHLVCCMTFTFPYFRVLLHRQQRFCYRKLRKSIPAGDALILSKLNSLVNRQFDSQLRFES